MNIPDDNALEKKTDKKALPLAVYRSSRDLASALERLKSSEKLSLADRETFAKNLGRMFMEATRKDADLNMKRFFLEVFVNLEVAESAYKKRKTFIWLGSDSGGCSSKNLKAQGHHYLQFLPALESRIFEELERKESAAGLDTSKLLSQLIEGSSLDVIEGHRVRFEESFRVEIDKRFQQCCDGVVNAVDLKWLYEYLSRAKVTALGNNGALAGFNLQSIPADADIREVRWMNCFLGTEEQSNCAAPCVNLATVISPLSAFGNSLYSGECEMQVDLSDADLGNEDSIATELVWMLFGSELAARDDLTKEELEYLDCLKDDRALAKEEGDNYLNKDLPFYIDEEIESDLFCSLEEKMEQKEDSEVLSRVGVSSQLDFEIRFDAEEQRFKPFILWRSDVRPPNGESVFKRVSNSELPFASESGWDSSLPTIDNFVQPVNRRRALYYLGHEGQWDHNFFAFFPRDLIAGINEVQIFLMPSDAELWEAFEHPSYEQQGLVEGSEFQTVFSKPDPEFYDLLFATSYNGHKVEGSLASTHSTGVIAPGGTLASNVLSNLAYAPAEWRFDKRLLSDAVNKFDMLRQDKEAGESEYLTAIEKNLSKL